MDSPHVPDSPSNPMYAKALSLLAAAADATSQHRPAGTTWAKAREPQPPPPTPPPPPPPPPLRRHRLLREKENAAEEEWEQSFDEEEEDAEDEEYRPGRERAPSKVKKRKAPAGANTSKLAKKKKTGAPCQVRMRGINAHRPPTRYNTQRDSQTVTRRHIHDSNRTCCL